MKPLYLIKGSDPSLVLTKTNELVRSIVADDDPSLVVEHLEADQATRATLASACNSLPFLASKRVVLVRQAGALSLDAVASLVEYFASPVSSTAVVLAGGGGQVSAKLVAMSKKIGLIIDAEPPKGAARQKWIADLARQKGIALDPAALALVAEHLGDDLERTEGILGALGALQGSGRLTRAAVMPYLGQQGDVPPWDLTDAIAQGNASKALVLLKRMTLAGGRHPLVILSIMHRQFVSAFRLSGGVSHSEESAAALLGVSPYSARKSLSMARTLGYERLGEALTLLGKADLDVRGNTALEPDFVVEILVARLARLSRASGRVGR